MSARLALGLAALFMAPLLAGCASNSPGATQAPTSSRPGGFPAGAEVVPPPSPLPKGTSERWHFHDYWHGNPTITLLDVNVTLNATMGPGVLLELPQGVIVPPETGFLLVNTTWAAPPAQGGPASVINLSFRPSDSTDFYYGGEAPSGQPIRVNTSESMCDVPHRQKSFWLLNLTAHPSPDAPALPGPGLRVVVTATIGRPLFIDPPHVNWWQSSDVIPLAMPTSGRIDTATTPAGNVTIPDVLGGAPPSAPPSTTRAQESYRVPATPGHIVPEGSQSVVVMLNWTADGPGFPKLAVAFAESNSPSAGPMKVAKDGAAQRIFVVPVIATQTDTTYSNRTTWEFRVLPEGNPPVFDGTFTLTAWATRLAPDDAVKALVPS